MVVGGLGEAREIQTEIILLCQKGSQRILNLLAKEYCFRVVVVGRSGKKEAACSRRAKFIAASSSFPESELGSSDAARCNSIETRARSTKRRWGKAVRRGDNAAPGCLVRAVANNGIYV